MAGGISMLSNEKRLIKDLLKNYENVGIVGRPVRNTSETITVYFGLALIQILDLDEKNQILNTNVWSRYVRVRSLMSPPGEMEAVARDVVCDVIFTECFGRDCNAIASVRMFPLYF